MKKRSERKGRRNRSPRGVKVVVEYRFRAYSPPDDLEALLADDCRVTYADAPVTGTNLADVRAALAPRPLATVGPLDHLKRPLTPAAAEEEFDAVRWAYRSAGAADAVVIFPGRRTVLPPGVIRRLIGR